MSCHVGLVLGLVRTYKGPLGHTLTPYGVRCLPRPADSLGRHYPRCYLHQAQPSWRLLAQPHARQCVRVSGRGAGPAPYPVSLGLMKKEDCILSVQLRAASTPCQEDALRQAGVLAGASLWCLACHWLWIVSSTMLLPASFSEPLKLWKVVVSWCPTLGSARSRGTSV